MLVKPTTGGKTYRGTMPIPVFMPESKPASLAVSLGSAATLQANVQLPAHPVYAPGPGATEVTTPTVIDTTGAPNPSQPNSLEIPTTVEQQPTPNSAPAPVTSQLIDASNTYATPTGSASDSLESLDSPSPAPVAPPPPPTKRRGPSMYRSHRKGLLIALLVGLLSIGGGGSVMVYSKHQAAKQAAAAAAKAAQSTATTTVTAGSDSLLTVNGGLKVSGSTSLNSLSVNGGSSLLNGLSILGDLATSGNAKIDGLLAASNLTISGNATVSGNLQATNITGSFTGNYFGNGQGLSNLDATTLSGEPLSFFEDSANQLTGTLDDARLSANVALLDANNDFGGANSFAGIVTLQSALHGQSAVFGSSVAATSFTQNGNQVCDTSGNCGSSTTVDGLTGAITLQGTTNQAIVTVSGQTITVQLPQDIATTSTPSFSGVGVANSVTFGNGSTIFDSTSDGLTITTNGRTYVLPASGVSVQTICTTGISCAAGGGQGVLLGPATAQNNNQPNPGVFINNTAGANLIELQANGVDKFVVSNSGSVTATSFSGDGSNVTNVNAIELAGQNGSYYTNASNINSGTLADSHLSADVTLQGNAFNGASQLVQLTANGSLPALNGSNLTNVNAATLQGYAASYFTNASNLSSGTLADGRLSSNVPLLNASNTFTGTTNSFTTLTAASLIQNGHQVCDISGNCAGVGGAVSTTGGTSGTIALFTGSQSIGNSILTQAGTTVSVGGTLSATTLQGDGSAVNNLSGSNISHGTVGVSVGGTGASSFTTNGVVFGNGGALGSTAAGTTGTCLVATTNGPPSWQTCSVAAAGATPGGAAGGDLSGTYPNPQVSGLKGTALSISNLTASNFLVYNGTNWVNQSLSGDLTATGNGVVTIGNGVVTNAKLANSSLTVMAGNGLSGGGSVSLGSSTSLSVVYGSGANTAAQGNVTVTCPAAGSNLAGGGNTLTVGAGGVCGTLAVIANPSFTSLTLSAALAISSGGTGAATASGARTNLGAAASGANSDITSLSGLTTALAVGEGGTGVSGSAAANGALLIGNGSGYTLANLTQGSGISITNTSGAISIAVNNTVCTTSGNCASTGGGVTTTGGTTNTIALFNGSQTIGNSIITQSGTTTINVAGTLSATALQGDGSLITNLNASNLASGTVASARLSGSYSGITGTGALSAGSIAAGFGVISTGNTISTTAALQGNSLAIGSGTFSVNSSGAVTAATGITSSGGITFSSLNSVGVVHTDGSGNLSTGAVALGTDTSGSYVANLGTLTGLTTTGNSGAGSTPTLSVTYGAAVNTAAQGNTSLSFSGSGNLTGTVSGTAGGGLTTNTLTVVNNPTFSGLVSAQGGLSTTNVSFSGTLTQSGSGAITFSGLGQGLVQTSSSGVLSGGAVDRNSGTYFTNNLSVANGGTGASTASTARTNLGAAASGANSDITSLGSVTSVSGGSALTVGSTAQSLLLQGSSTTLSDTSGSYTTNVGFATPTDNVTYLFQTAVGGTYNICTSVGNCAGSGGGVTTTGGTNGTIALFNGSQTIGNSILTQSGTTVTVGGTLGVNTITPTAALVLGASSQNVTLQGAAVAITATNGSYTNTLNFATPGSANHNISLPNASGTVAVSASGPLSLDANGNLTCTTCVTSGGSGGGAAAVDSLNTLTGALSLQGTTNQVIVSNNSGTGTITLSLPQSINTSSSPTFSSLTLTNNLAVTNAVSSGSLAVSGAATAGTVNGLSLTSNSTGFSVAGGTTVSTLNVTASNVTLNQNLSTTSAPSFAGLTLSSALTVANGGTGATTASGARANLGAAASGSNSDITAINGLTTALPVAEGGTGATTASGARTNLGAAASGANSDITSITGLTTKLATSEGGTGVDGSSATNGQLLIGNGGGYTLTNLTQGSGIAITNGSGAITIAIDNTVCTTSGNCAGAGGGVTTTGGTSGTIALFTGTQAIGNSIVTQSGTTVSVGGTLSATALQGDGSLITNLNASNLASGTVPTGRISGTYSGLTGTGALTTGSIGSGFGTIATGNSISTTAALQGNSLTIGSGTFTVNSSGAVTAATGITSSGSVVFSSLNLAGVVHTSATGALSTSAVALGSETTGNYVATLGSLTGLTTSGNSGAGSTPSLSVIYGASTNTAAQGSTVLSFSGSGNLTGTVSGTAGGGLTTNTLAIVSNPTFTGLVSAQGGLSVGVAGATPGSIVLASNGSGSVTLQSAAQSNAVALSIPADAHTSDTICLVSVGNCTGVNSGSGNTSYIENTTTVQAGSSFYIQPTAGNVAATIGANGSGDLLDFRDSSGNKLATVSSTGQLTLGRITNSGSGTQGQLLFSDGTTDGYGLTIQSGTLTASQTITIPASTSITDTVCLVSLGNCTGSNGGGGNGNYIFNTTTQQASSNFNISGNGTVGGVLQVNGTGLIKATSSTALQVQNSSGVNALQVDTSQLRVFINDTLQTANQTASSTNSNNLSLLSGNASGSGSASGYVRIDTGTAATVAGIIKIGDTNASAIVLGHSGTGVSIPSANSLSLGTASSQTGSILFNNASGTGTLMLQSGATSGNLTFTLPTADGINGACLTTNGSGALSFGSCTGTPGSNAANTALSNLSSVAINTNLQPATAGAVSVGTSSLPFSDLYLSGTSSTAGSNNFRLTGVATAARTITLPDSSGTVCLSNGNCNGAGATLQTAYTNSAGGTTPEIKLNSTQAAFDIQDADSSLSGNLFNVRGSNSSGLGNSLFTVNSSGQVGIGLGGVNTPSADLSFGSGATRVINVLTPVSNTAGNNLSLQAGNGGSGSTAVAGGNLVLQGGNAAGITGNVNGGNVYVYGGQAVNSGTAGNTVLAYNGSQAVGAVGIGTASPAYLLDVQGGDINTSGGLRTGGTTRLDNAGNLTSIATEVASGNISGGSLSVGTTASTYTLSVVNSGTVGFVGASTYLHASSASSLEFTNNNSTTATVAITGAQTTTGGVNSQLQVNGIASGGGVTIETYRGTTTAPRIYSTGTSGASNNLRVDSASSGSLLLQSVTGGDVGINSTAPGAQLEIDASASTVGQIIKANSGSPGDLLQLQNSGGTVLSGFNSSGQLYLQNSGYASTITQATLSQAQTLTIPASTHAGGDIFCLQYTGNCGSGVSASGTANYVARFTGTTSLGIGALYDNGSQVGINNTTFATNNKLVINTPVTADSAATVQIATGAAANKGLVIQGAANQTANLLGIQDSNGIGLARFNASGQLLLGNPTTSGTAYQGSLAFADGTADGDTVVFKSATQSGSSTTYNVSIPALVSGSDTICLQQVANCGSSAPTLQNVYTNSVGGTTPEIIEDSTRTSLDVQGYSGQTADLLDVRTYQASGLGTAVLSVGSTGNLTVVTGSSNNAFVVKNGSTVLLQGDTANSSLGINGASTSAGYGLNVTGSINASTGLYVGGTNISSLYLQNTTTQQASSNFNISGAGVVGTTLSVGSTVNAVSGYSFNGTAGTTTTCAAGNAIGGAVVQGGIITGGSCGPVAPASGSANYIQNNPSSAQTANFNIVGTTSTVAAVVQGASGQDIADFKNSGATIVDSFDQYGNLNINGSGTSAFANGLTVNGSSAANSSAFKVNNTTGTILSVDASGNRVVVGNNTSCGGKLCVGTTVTGTGGSTVTNLSSQTSLGSSVTSATTIVGGAVGITDTGTTANTLQGLNISYAGTTNTAAAYQGISVTTPASGAAGSYFLQFTNNSTSELKVDTSGNLTLAGTVNAATGYSFNGTPGSTTTCASGSSLGTTVVQGGIITGGSCVAVAPGTAASYIQNGTTQQASSNFNISGAGVIGTTLGVTGVATFTAQAVLSGGAQVAAQQTINFVGGTTAQRPASPTAGMLYFDNTTNQLLQYNGSKWVGSRSTNTAIVAPSNATQAEKDAADYVASGSGDQATINAALTAAAGGSVYLIEGTYNLSAAISVPNNTTLIGSGNGTLIMIPNSQNASYNLIQNSDTSTGTGVIIQNLRLDGNKANNTSGTMNGIYLNSMGSGSSRAGARIVGVTANNLTNNGIFLFNSSSNTVTANNTQGNTANGIAVTSSSSNNTITGNTSQTNGSGIYVSASNNNTITGNLTQSNTSIGIYLIASGNTVTGNTSQGNSIGAYLTSSTTNTITGNIFQTNASSGLTLSGSSNNNISANKFYDNGGSAANNGVTLSASSLNNSITSNDITDSNCSTTCYAINISDSGSTGNYLSSNRYTGDGTHPATINDVSTTTYADQINSSGQLVNAAAGALVAKLQASGNTNDLFQLQNSTGTVLSKFGSNGQLTLGTIAASGTNQAGQLTFGDGTTDNFGLTLQSATLSHADTVTIPYSVGYNGTSNTYSDTVCLLLLQNCVGTGSGVTATGSSNTNYLARFSGNQTVTAGDVYDDGTQVGVFNTSTGNGQLNVGSTSATLSALFLQGSASASSSTATEVIKLAASQVGDAIDVKNSSNAILFKIDSSGNITSTGNLSSTAGNTALSVTTNGVLVTRSSTESTTALQVQNTAGTTIFNVDTSAGVVGTPSVSAASTASTAFKLQSGTATGSGTTSSSGVVSLQSGNSTNGSTGNLTVSSGNTNAAGSGLQSGNLALSTGTTNGTNTAGSITLDTGYNLNTGLGSTIYIGNNYATSVSIGSTVSTVSLQGGNGGLTLSTAGSNGKITLGSASNGLILAAASATNANEPSLTGSARHTKSIVIPAEYAGAVLDSSNDSTCSGANNGSMVSGFTTSSGLGSGYENYYDWSSSQTSANCYDVVVQVPVPSDFDGWNGTSSIDVYSSNTSNATAALDIRDTTGAVDGTAYGTSLTPAIASTWGTKTFSFANTYSYSASAGKYITLRIRMSSNTNAHFEIGNIKLNYYSHY